MISPLVNKLKILKQQFSLASQIILNIHIIRIHIEQNLYLEGAAKFDGEKALITLGDSYYKNRNYVDAKQFYERAAKQGNTYALKKLGDMFIGGQGVQKCYSKAKEYYEEAARKGCLEAMKCLGDIYFYGFGVEKDFSRAVIYYQRSGDDNSFYDFGNMYLNGQGVEKDPIQAKEYFQQSAKLGNEKALMKLICHYCDYNYCKYFTSFFIKVQFLEGM